MFHAHRITLGYDIRDAATDEVLPGEGLACAAPIEIVDTDVPG